MLTQGQVDEIALTVCPEQRDAFMDFVSGKDAITIVSHGFSCEKCPEALMSLGRAAGGMFSPGAAIG